MPTSGRLASNLLIVLSVLIGLMLTHSGACAALAVSSPAGNADRMAADTPWNAPVLQAVECHHRSSPAGHQHVTEADDLAIASARTIISLGGSTSVSVSSGPSADRHVLRRRDVVSVPAPDLLSLRVMRI